MRLIKEVARLQQAHLTLFHTQLANPAGEHRNPAGSTTGRATQCPCRRISSTLRKYIGLHEARIAVGVDESRASSVHAESVTRQLVLVALVFGLGLAAVASYNILRPLRRLQAVIQEMGQGNFRASLDSQAPRESRELGDTVKWMGTNSSSSTISRASCPAHVSHELRTPMASIQEGNASPAG